MLKRSLAVLLLAATTAAAGLAHAEAPKPLLWKVSDADNSIYLLGSFHLLKPSDYPLADSTYAALADAERVVFELSPAEMGDPGVGQRMAQAATRTDGKTLQSTLPEDTWAALQVWAAQRRVPIANLQALEPWFVSLVVSITEMQLMGLNPEHGLDKHFAQRAEKDGKAVAGLETGDLQIALFDGMDAKEQVHALQQTLEEVSEGKGAIDRMHALWRAGDDQGLHAEIVAEMETDYPDLYQRLLLGRNQAWMPKLGAMLDDSQQDDALVVVGAAHLIGKDGVVQMLEAKGYKVERL